MSFGLYLAWQLSKAAGDSGEVGELCERRGLTVALLLELLASTVLYAGRHILWLRAHPDHAFLAYFARTHLTVTLSLLLILVPKVSCDNTLVFMFIFFTLLPSLHLSLYIHLPVYLTTLILIPE